MVSVLLFCEQILKYCITQMKHISERGRDIEVTESGEKKYIIDTADYFFIDSSEYTYSYYKLADYDLEFNNSNYE